MQHLKPSPTSPITLYIYIIPFFTSPLLAMFTTANTSNLWMDIPFSFEPEQSSTSAQLFTNLNMYNHGRVLQLPAN